MTTSNQAKQVSPAPAAKPSSSPAIPQAVLKRQRRWNWAWLVPAVALVVVGAIGYQAWTQRGTNVLIHFDHGHGLKPGDVLRYRGIVVGKVNEITVSPDLEGIEVAVNLSTEADRLARMGSRFWIVRPQIDMTGVEGLETIVGANYLAVLPGQGAAQHEFIGMEEPPVAEKIEADGLEIMLQSPDRGSLRPGAAVSYRQFRIGTVLSVGLASDASAVEARAYIRPAYRELVREKSVFWDSGGVRWSAGWTGFSLDVDSAEALVTGGVSLATPPDAGAAVGDGHRFSIAEKPDDEWYTWTPSLAVSNQLLPPDAVAPQPVRVALTWKKDGMLWNKKQERHGWAVAVPGYLLGPADLLSLPEDTVKDSGELSVAGDTIKPRPARLLPGGAALLPLKHKLKAFPRERIREAKTPEDTLIVADRNASPVFVAAARYRQEAGAWLIDPSLSFDPIWHGAAVVSVADGNLVGVLLLDEDSGARMATIHWPQAATATAAR